MSVAFSVEKNATLISTLNSTNLDTLLLAYIEMPLLCTAIVDDTTFLVGLGRAKTRPEIWPAGHGF